MKKKFISMLAILVISVSMANAQETEVKITLSEQFFDALLEAVFNNLDEPKVPISIGASNFSAQEPLPAARYSSISNQYSRLATQYSPLSTQNSSACDETVRLKREIGGVRTAVRFRNGKILAPIAFDGDYNPPLIGCIGFSGWAETTIDLSFDKSKNALVGRAKILNVNLSGTNGMGSGLVTRLAQNSIDKKINPLEIVKLDMLSFTAPIQNTGKLKMEAVGVRHIVKDKEIEVFLKYRFKKG